MPVEAAIWAIWPLSIVVSRSIITISPTLA